MDTPHGGTGCPLDGYSVIHEEYPTSANIYNKNAHDFNDFITSNESEEPSHPVEPEYNHQLQLSQEN